MVFWYGQSISHDCWWGSAYEGWGIQGTRSIFLSVLTMGATLLACSNGEKNVGEDTYAKENAMNIQDSKYWNSESFTFFRELGAGWNLGNTLDALPMRGVQDSQKSVSRRYGHRLRSCLRTTMSA